MQTGYIIADRFELGAVLGSGGMGVVFRAIDHATGADVAVKVLRDAGLEHETRLEREAQVLAGLHHPHIVRYIAHGTSANDEAYLVMEWIEGEDLGRRLQRGRLRVDACVALGARVASALAEAHAGGVIHRDIKPSNLFLPGGDLTRVKVLDFGIARISGVTRSTQTGAVLGTPGYLPPEQVRGESVLDPCADVFSLGCVLFECLTGAPAFAGQHLAAILAKILFEPAPSARALWPDVPEAVDELITRMLSKDPGDRPSSAEVTQSLASLERLARDELGQPRRLSALPAIVPSLTTDEQRVLSVIVIGAARIEPARTSDPGVAMDALLLAARARGARLEPMADGSMAAILLDALPPLDEAEAAARLAQALHAIVPERVIVMATGRSGGLFKRTVGDAINRAVFLLEACARAGIAPDAVLVDDASARLLEKRFELRVERPGFAILGERDPGAAGFTLLGRSSPFVGRKAELGVLAALFTACVDDAVPHAALVTGPSGSGKSRFAQEFLRVVRRDAPTVAVWSAQGAAPSTGAVFGMLAQALRGAAGLRRGAPVEASRERLRAHVAERISPADRARVTEFLGELVGVPFPDDTSPSLWAARMDARLMREQLVRAWADLVRAECAQNPVVLVLDDVQWSDAATVRTVTTALANLKDLPFFVLGLARPEVTRIFPKLWGDQGALHLPLKDLSRKAAADLVTHALGARATPSLVDRLLLQADGHVLYLEELVRAVAAGRADPSPETTLALMGARLEQHPAEARRVLRAASVFGEVAWAGGVAALVTDTSEAEIGRHLEDLVTREVLVRRVESRFPGQPEYAFRHALLREGAYAMLTDADRALGHRLAGDWLELHGESDALALAGHFERAGATARAAQLYARVAEQAHSVGDSDSAVDHARRGLALEPPTTVRGELLGVLCHAYLWRCESDAAAAVLDEALLLTRPGSTPWVHAVTARFALSIVNDVSGASPDELDTLLVTPIDAGAEGPIFPALCGSAFALDLVGRFDTARGTLGKLEAIVQRLAPSDPVARGWIDLGRAHLAAIETSDPWLGLGLARGVAAAFQDADYRRGLPASRFGVGMCLSLLGAFEEGERALQSSVVSWAPLDFSLLTDYFLAQARFDHGANGAALEAARALVDRSRELAMPRHEGRGHWLLAQLHARAADLGAADREVALAVEQMPEALTHHLAARVLLASIRLAQRRFDEALRLAEEVHRVCAARKIAELPALLAYAEALHAAGAVDRARARLAEAHDLLLARAEAVGAPALRRSFVTRVPVHARVLELVAAWHIKPEPEPGSDPRPVPALPRVTL